MKNRILITAFAALFIIGGCKPVTVRPVDNDIVMLPLKGTPYTVVGITGLNFDNVKTNNVVKFNGIEALVDSVGPNQIFVTVPKYAITGKVTVAAHGITKTSLVDFKVVKPVKEYVEKQSTDYNLSALAFDRTGIMYGLNTLRYETADHFIGVRTESVIKNINGQKSIFYRLPDSTNTDTRYSELAGITVDSKGNIFTGKTDYYLDAGGFLHISKSEIIKILPNGTTSEFAVSFSNITELTTDIFDNIYAIDADTVKKITQHGQISVFTNIRMKHVTTDRIGNIYVNDQQTLLKFSQQGVQKASFPINIDYPYTVSGTMVVDQSGNIIVMKGSEIRDPKGSFINQVGFNYDLTPYLSRSLPQVVYDPQIKVAIDPFGRIYLVESTIISTFSIDGPIGTITRYSYQ